MRVKHQWWSGLVAAVLGGLVGVTVVAAGEQFLPVLARREGALRFWGGSFIADPFGEVAARASRSKEEVLVASIDLDRIRVSQEGWRFLDNRRPQSYSDLVR